MRDGFGGLYADEVAPLWAILLICAIIVAGTWWVFP